MQSSNKAQVLIKQALFSFIAIAILSTAARANANQGWPVFDHEPNNSEATYIGCLRDGILIDLMDVPPKNCGPHRQPGKYPAKNELGTYVGCVVDGTLIDGMDIPPKNCQ